MIANCAPCCYPRLVGQTLTTFVNSESGSDLAEVAELIESGKLRPVIDRTYPLAQAVTAIQYVAGRHARGKVVITLD